jgi:hypothetical protein
MTFWKVAGMSVARYVGEMVVRMAVDTGKIVWSDVEHFEVEYGRAMVKSLKWKASVRLKPSHGEGG